jgi:hypothetical protein
VDEDQWGERVRREREKRKEKREKRKEKREKRQPLFGVAVSFYL